MTQHAPPDFQPSNRELYDRIGGLVQLVQEVKGKADQTARDVGTLTRNSETTNAILFGDRSRGIAHGVIERLEAVEKTVDAANDKLDVLSSLTTDVKDLKVKEGARAEREVRADARQKLIVSIAGFLGITNIAGVLALIAYLTGVIHP